MTYDSEVAADSPWFYGKTDEASGNILDSSGSSRTLTLPGGSPTYAQTGPSGAADAQAWPDSSGGTEYYAVSSASPGSTATWTLECWVYLTATPTNPTGLISIAYGYANTSKRPLHLYVDTDGKVKLAGGSSSATNWASAVASASAISLNAWHHVVAKTTATTQAIRVDKVEVATGTFSTSVTTTDLVFLHGGGNHTLSSLVDSSAITIAKPAVYLSTLSDARIDAHYDAMSGGGGTAASGTASLSLSASGSAKAPAAGSAALALSASGAAATPASGTASLSLSASGTAAAPGAASGTASLSLSASGGAAAPAAASASLSLSAGGTATLPASGTASLTLSATGSAHHTSTGYAALVNDLNPIAYYRLGEASGTVMVDDLGVHDGTYQVAPTLGATGCLIGDADTAVTFTGSNQGSVGYWSGLNTTTLTYVGLVRISPINAGRPIAGRLGGTSSPIMIGTNGSGRITVTINDGTGQTTYTAATAVNDGNDHHIAVRRNTGTGVLSVFVDGVVDLSTSSVAPDTATTYGWILGGDVDFGSVGTKGTLDEWALFGTALADGDIASLAVSAVGEHGGASLTLSASGGTVAASAGTATLTLTALGQMPVAAAGTATLELSGDGAAMPLVLTDTANALAGRVRHGIATVTITRPVATVPPAVTLGQRYDKALAFPEPVMVDGRPT